MKRIFLLLVVACLSTASAQAYVGAKTGGNNFHVGFPVSPEVEARVDADFFLGNSTSLGLGVDILSELYSPSNEVTFYAGGGPSFGYSMSSFDDGFGEVSVSEGRIGLHGLFGARYIPQGQSQFGLFGELGAVAQIWESFYLTPSAEIGVNFYFQ